MHKHAALLVLAATLAAPCLARADSYAEPRKKGWKAFTFEGAMGILAGSMPVGYVGGGIAAPHVDLGVRKDRLLLYGTGALGSIGESSYDQEAPVRGMIGRLGVGVRYSFGRLGGGRGEVPLRGQFWIQGGLGWQHIQWNEGGRLGRQDAVLGIGAQIDFRINRQRPRYIGLYYALDITFAPAPAAKDRPPMCAGPCDEATGPGTTDIGFMLNVGVPFGK